MNRMTGALANAVAVGSVAVLAPVAVAPVAAAPAVAAASTVAAAPTAAPAAARTGERNIRVSRSMTGIRPSAYVGRYYSTRHERTRKCIVRKESRGNYRIASRTGRYRGAYQFNYTLARSTARKMGRADLARKPFNTWSRFEQDKAFWTVWNHGRGRSHWPTARGC